MSTVETRVDPVTAAVIAGALDSIAVEMGHKLARMAYSSIIRESEDFGCVLCDAEARQLCESSQSTPLQSGPIPGYIAGHQPPLRRARPRVAAGRRRDPQPRVLRRLAPAGRRRSSCRSSTGSELVGFSATTAHHLDLGALTPGSCGIVDATDAYAEGLQFNAIKIEEEGRKNEFIWQILRDNCRAPQLVVGDMEAQVAAAKIGAGRFVELIDRYGLEIDPRRQRGPHGLLRAHAAHARSSGCPDGTYEAEGHLDGFVDHPDPAYSNLKIKVAVTVEGSEITVDLTGTAPQVDLPINMPLVGTVDIAIWVTLRSILLDAWTHDPVPTNSGLFRAITIVAPEGCIANPTFPAPDDRPLLRRQHHRRHAHARARARAAGGRERRRREPEGRRLLRASAAASTGSTWTSRRAATAAAHGKDGLDAVDTLYANTRNNPIEDIESHFPLRVTQYELLEDRGGPGRWRGGLGTHARDRVPRRRRLLARGRRLDWRSARPLRRQATARPARCCSTAGTRRRAVELPSKFPYRKAAAGDRLCLISPCGGGYGDPLERDRDAVRPGHRRTDT